MKYSDSLKQLEKYTDSQKELKIEIENLKKSNDSLKLKISEKNKTIQESNSLLGSHSKTISDLKNTISENNLNLKNLELEIKNLNIKHSEIINGVESNIKKIREENNNYILKNNILKQKIKKNYFNESKENFQLLKRIRFLERSIDDKIKEEGRIYSYIKESFIEDNLLSELCFEISNTFEENILFLITK